MDITPPIDRNTCLIQNYSVSGVVAGDILYAETCVAVFATGVVVCDYGALQDIDAAFLSNQDVDILLIGSSQGVQALNRDLKQNLLNSGVRGIEVMPPSAACDTYNVLIAEGRKVAALIFTSLED